jgi:hypothetical protein
MKTTKARKRKGGAAVACTDLLAALRKYEQKHPTQMRLPHLRLFCDGSGALIVHDVEMFEFHDIGDLMKQLKAANTWPQWCRASDGRLQTEAPSRHPLQAIR